MPACYRGPAVLDEACELLRVAATTEVSLGEADVGEHEILRGVGQIQGSPAERDGEIAVPGGTGLRAGGREQGGRACALTIVRVGEERAVDALGAPLRQVEVRVNGEALAILLVEGGEERS